MVSNQNDDDHSPFKMKEPEEKKPSIFTDFNITGAFRQHTEKTYKKTSAARYYPTKSENPYYNYTPLPVSVRYNHDDDPALHDFLLNGPKSFAAQDGDSNGLKKFQLKNGDFIHCILYNGHFYITGTDIVKLLMWKFNHVGINIISLKKFEEGIFSDLRNLKPGIDATLEPPRSPFLEFLYKNGCIRTQKKQKVFFWYSVPHNVLFNDGVERERRREEETRQIINSYGVPPRFVNKYSFINYGGESEVRDPFNPGQVDFLKFDESGKKDREK